MFLLNVWIMLCIMVFGVYDYGIYGVLECNVDYLIISGVGKLC